MPDDVEWPTANVGRASEWARIRERSGAYEKEKLGLDVTGYERTRVYENAALRERVARQTVGRVDATLASFFASRIDLRGSATAAASAGEIAERVDPRFRERLADHGVEDLREVSPGDPAPDVGGPQAVVREYEGAYRTREIDRTVDIDGVGERRFAADPDDVPTAGLYAVWKDGVGTAYASGGVFPTADYEDAATLSLTGDEGEGIDVEVRLTLSFGPDDLRREVVSLVESVE